jgi:sulfur carrier protein
MTDRVTEPTAEGRTHVTVTVNGEPARLPAGSTIADLVRALLDDADPKGVAVAVDRCVIPRSEWGSTPVRPGALVEVVGAAAGG